MRTLWAISDELDAIAERIAEAGGEITPELEAELDAVEGDFTAKVERVALFVRQLEVDADGAEVEEKRLAGIKQANKNKAAGLKSYLLEVLTKNGRDKVDTQRARVRIQKSGTPAIHYTGDLLDLPVQFVRVVPESLTLNKVALTEVVRAAGQLPDGVSVTYSKSVRIS